MRIRELREHVLRLLFCMEFHPAEEFEEQAELYTGALLEPSEKEVAYIHDKCSRIFERRAVLDEKINSVATGWKTERMAKADLILIRIALYEMTEDETVPTGVAINEAVELAKRYGSDESARFVNSVLAKLA